MATAFLYNDGSFVFSSGDTADSTKTLLASYTGWDTDTYPNYNFVPWYSDGNYTKIISVSFEGTVAPVSTEYWFYNCTKLTSLDATNLDTSNVTFMQYMFSGCSSLTSLDLSNFDTSKVIDMMYMFSSCYVITSLDLSSFDTSNVTDMQGMFNGCFDLTYLDLSSFDTSKVTDMEHMFSSCSALTTIYVSEKWSISTVTYSSSMFTNCTSLVGGKGTTFNSSITDVTYARLDTADAPGYFTYMEPLSTRLNLIKEITVRNIAKAIRKKGKFSETYLPSEMDEAIAAIETCPDDALFLRSANELIYENNEVQEYSYFTNILTNIFDDDIEDKTLQDGDICLITINGTVYECTAYEYGNPGGPPYVDVWIGNGEIDGEVDHFEDVPFLIFCNQSDWHVATDYPCTLKIEKKVGDIKSHIVDVNNNNVTEETVQATGLLDTELADQDTLLNELSTTIETKSLGIYPNENLENLDAEINEQMMLLNQIEEAFSGGSVGKAGITIDSNQGLFSGTVLWVENGQMNASSLAGVFRPFDDYFEADIGSYFIILSDDVANDYYGTLDKLTIVNYGNLNSSTLGYMKVTEDALFLFD